MRCLGRLCGLLPPAAPREPPPAPSADPDRVVPRRRADRRRPRQAQEVPLASEGEIGRLAAADRAFHGGEVPLFRMDTLTDGGGEVPAPPPPTGTYGRDCDWTLPPQQRREEPGRALHGGEVPLFRMDTLTVGGGGVPAPLPPTDAYCCDSDWTLLPQQRREEPGRALHGGGVPLFRMDTLTDGGGGVQGASAGTHGQDCGGGVQRLGSSLEADGGPPLDTYSKDWALAGNLSESEVRRAPLRSASEVQGTPPNTYD